MRKTLESINITEADLPGMEDDLCALLGRFLQFSAHGIYFPKKGETCEMTFLPDEKRVLLPLNWRSDFLGMLMLSGIKTGRTRRLLPWLPALASLALEHAALTRAMNMDLQSGLATEECFFAHMEEEAASVRSFFSDPVQSGFSHTPLYKMCLGMVVICWYDGLLAAREFDYEFCRHIHEEMAKTIKREIPAQAVAAALGRHEGRHDFGILFNSSGRGACQKLANKLVLKLEEMVFTDGPSGRKYRPRLYGGHALYPQDMRGDELWLPMFEQAGRLRDRARLAARTAFVNHLPDVKIMSFAGILRKGGRLLEDARNGRVRVNFGLAANAREGMRFNVYEPCSGEDEFKIKGQIVLLETGIMESAGEVFYLKDASAPLKRGDMLAPVDDAREENERDAAQMDKEMDDMRGLKSHGEFLSLFPAVCAAYGKFILAIMRLDNKDGNLDAFFKFAEKESGELSCVAAHYGSNGLIFFIPDADVPYAINCFRKFSELAKDLKLDFACGIFYWPNPNFGKQESEQCALKALEYASLLPEPRIGEFNSMALTISADKKFSLGDKFGAIEEYKLALLADPANALARNSLGVCMGVLGKLEDAKKLLVDAMACAREAGLKAKICYNLGTVYQKEGDADAAWKWYRGCLKHDKNHVFAWLRTGQLSEQKGRKANARRYYMQAARLAGDDSEVLNIAHRNIARLEAASAKNDSARAILHDALLREPGDAASLCLLAQMYLGKNGDATVAELLARKSVKLGNEAKAWETLALALDAQGKTEEAQKAMQRARK